MHRNQFRPDKEATKARHFDSRYSYVSRRIHPETTHSCEYLAGLKDTGARRLEVFTRDGFMCVTCGIAITWASGHMAHGGNTKISRCDCLENLSTKCRECHLIREHNRELKWSSAWTR
jgi:hypothetical protein